MTLYRPVPSLLAVLLVPGCADPPVVPTGDTPAPASIISGQVYNPTEGADTLLFLYSCDDLPPPDGTGRPLDLVVVPFDQLDQGRAEFVFPQVAAGEPARGGDTAPGAFCYRISALSDEDHDFHPSYGVTAQPTAGDQVSVAVEVWVSGAGRVGGAPPPVDDVVIRVDTEVPLDRPAFRTSELVLALGEQPGTTPPAVGVLETSAIDSALVAFEQPFFTVVLEPDADGDGLPDDLNGDGLPDVRWPRILAVQLADSDASGLTLADGGYTVPLIVQTVDPADPFNPDTNLALLAASRGIPLDGASPLLLDALTVFAPALHLTSLDPPVAAPLEPEGEAARGRYQLLVMNQTGQLWTLPNELALEGYVTQGAALTIE